VVNAALEMDLSQPRQRKVRGSFQGSTRQN
jgi:hypothetical protein